MSRATRVMTLGYQGFGNVGDEAILTGIEHALRGIDDLEVIAVAGGSQAPIAAFPDRPRVHIPRFLPGWTFLRTLGRADVLIMAGGGVINDYWPTLIPRYLSWVLLARLLGTRVVWVSVGVGPFRHRLMRELAGLMLRLGQLVTVRDAASASSTMQVAPNVRVSIIPDPAYLNEPPAPSTAAEGLAIVVRGPAPGERALTPVLASAIAELVRNRAGHSRVTLLPMHLPVDEETIAAVETACDSLPTARPDVLPLSLQPGTAIRQLASFELVLSVRLHGLILASLAGRPCVPIVYDQKVASAAAELGLLDLAVPIEEASGERLSRSLELVSAAPLQLDVRDRVTSLRSRVSGGWAEVVEALLGKPEG